MIKVKKQKYSKFWMLLAICICGLTACAGDKTKEETRIIVDSVGVEVEVPTEIDKIICVNQNAMEFIVAMGQRDKLIGVHKSIFNHTWSPEYISNLDGLTGYGYTPAAEAVFESDADLVIVKNASIAEELRTVGIPAITFQYTNKEEMFSSIDMLAGLFGNDEKAFVETWKARYEESERAVNTQLASVDENERVSTYFIDASTAIDAGNLCSTAGGDSIIETWFDASGIELITKHYTGLTSINEEEILEMNPKTILIGGWAENTRREQLFSDVKWSEIDAVKNENVYLVPDGFVSFERYAVEAPLLIEYTAYQMYPEYIQYDPITEFQQFFKEFYSIELSTEKIEYMLVGLSPDGSRMDK